MFAEDFVRIVRQFDLKTLSKDNEDPRLLPVDDGDEVMGEAPDELKILEAVRRHFRDQYARTKRKFYSLMSSNYGVFFTQKQTIRQLKLINEKRNEALLAAKALSHVERLYNLAIYEFAVSKAGQERVDEDKVSILMRKDWKVVLREMPDKRGDILFTAMPPDDPVSDETMTTDTAPLPAEFEKTLEGPEKPKDDKQKENSGADKDPPNDESNDGSAGEEDVDAREE